MVSAVRALAGDIVLFSWARHFALTVSRIIAGGNPAMD